MTRAAPRSTSGSASPRSPRFVGPPTRCCVALLPAGTEPAWRDQTGEVRLDQVYAPIPWIGRRIAELEEAAGVRVAFLRRLGDRRHRDAGHRHPGGRLLESVHARGPRPVRRTPPSRPDRRRTDARRDRRSRRRRPFGRPGAHRQRARRPADRQGTLGHPGRRRARRAVAARRRVRAVLARGGAARVAATS